MITFGSKDNFMEQQELEKIFKSAGFLDVDTEVSNDLEKIIEWQKVLKEVNIDNIEPLYNTIGDNEGIYNKDIAIKNNDDILGNIEEKDDNFFLVPKVIDKK